eukprot:1050140_1
MSVNRPGSRKRRFIDLTTNSDNETHYDHHDGSMGHYIGTKRRKLIQQFRNDVEIESNIFSGHVMFINGRTQPPLSVLKELVVSHGGIVMMTRTKHTTVMIADQLPISKRKHYNKTQSNLIITTPQWIIQSINAQKLLNPNRYPLSKQGQNKQSDTNDNEHNNQSNDHDEQQKLLKIFGARSTLTDPDFVVNFFKASRLHFIGSFKQIYEQILPKLQRIKPKYDTIQHRAHQGNKQLQRHIVHIDMDCYFVSVAIRDQPELAEKPCVVCHAQTNNGNAQQQHRNANVIPRSQSTAEISSASYAARQFGVNAGMLLGKALKLCPELILLPYKFDDYVAISTQIYQIFFSYSNMVQYKSIDEAFIEFVLDDTASISDIATSMRHDILTQTRCPCSAGIGSNILLARLATNKAKPNGTFDLNRNSYQTIMDPMDINALPGIGRKLQRKFNEELGIYSCGDLRRHKKWNQLRHLQAEFGKKSGLNIHNYLNGIDNRCIEVQRERKTIGAEIGWGVRFKRKDQLKKFIADLSLEVSKRMKRIDPKLKGKRITIKVKTKHPLAKEEAHKFLGHGWCNTVSRSVTLNTATNDEQVIAKQCWNLLANELRIDETIVRAVGVHLSKLNNRAMSNNNRSIQSMFERKDNKSNRNHLQLSLPSVSQIDQSVWDCLPRDIQNELRKAYDQKLGRESNANRGRNHNIKRANHAKKGKKQEEEERKENVCLFGEESFSEHRDVLVQWMKQNESPNESHQVILNVFIQDCIKCDRLQNIVCVLKYLKRFAQNNPNWKSIALSVTDTTQKTIQAKYQYKLQI